MENSSPVTSEALKEKHRKEFVFCGVVVGIIYAIPPASFFVFVVPYIALFSSFSLFGEKINDNEQFVTILLVLLFLICTLIVFMIAFFSGRAAYRSANATGSVWNTVIGILVSVVIFFIGSVIFSIASIVILGYFNEPTSENGIGIVLVGTVLGVCVAYIVALVSGGLTLKILGNRSAKLENNKKIEEGS